ncbi:uncharacterized protein GGS25DRAFT_488347 [Hypoxylon fragiforme]|uniref:uncharacterized protein n=1 Tax=Hypoxylon fragiforme TaxID=63214 RepID=UPI0020C64C87|nr:uncharacterized protein GGS25DRAFT_488347 [Hypoxylon fragiforme]KAI2610303.1 hypothetical protein GGS25DRAFT_488347 [Hypoxylon fragiforme]
MVMGQEERKNKARLEKTQISLATTNTEYENAVKALEETTARWNREWKAAADKFQDLEEERLDFTKSSLWTFANIASTVCVSDDSSCEKIRLSLEKMDVENDIVHFITEKGTGQEIPDPPKYINFCRGDVEDHPSEVSDDDNYSVAQFPRSINPVFRTSSPQPSTFESHHDPNSALARDLAHYEPPAPSSRELAIMQPQKGQSSAIMQQSRRQETAMQQQQYPQSINPGFRNPSPQPSTYESHHDPNSNLARQLQHRGLNSSVPRDIQVPREVQVPREMQAPREMQRHDPVIPPLSRELQRHDPNPHPRELQRREPDLPASRDSRDAPRYDQEPSIARDIQRHDHNPSHSRDIQRHNPNPSISREMPRHDPSPSSRHEPDLSLSRDLQRTDLSSSIPRDLQRNDLSSSIPRDIQRHEPNPSPTREPQRHEPELALTRNPQRYEYIPPPTRELVRNEPPPSSSREPAVSPQKAPEPVKAPQDERKGSNVSQYDPSQFAPVPHEPYPMDGMTMLCRTDGLNSATSSNMSARPSSREDENSDYSDPTSFSSQEPPSGKISPTKQEPVSAPAPAPAPAPVTAPAPTPAATSSALVEKRMIKKKSGFFQNHSPFRRKSIKDVRPQMSNRNTWGPVSTQSQSSSQQSTPIARRAQAFQQPQSQPQSQPQPQPQPQTQSVLPDRIEKTVSPEPIEANASLALNIGQNVFAVANTDKRKKAADDDAPPREEQDPIALALAELKGVTGSKQSAGRISADHYHGIATPAPDRAPDRSQPMPRPVPAPRASTDISAATRGTPPPSYDQQVPVQRLGVPPPAVTSKAMQESSRKYVEQTRDMFGAKRPQSSAYGSAQSYSASPSRPATRGNDSSREVPRATSPAAPIRAASPQPPPQAQPQPIRVQTDTRRSDTHRSEARRSDTRQSHRSVSPNPYTASQQRNSPGAASPSSYGGSRMQSSPQAASPTTYGGSQMRHSPQASMSVKRDANQSYFRHNSPSSSIRAPSPSPYRGDYSRPTSRASEMAMQLAPVGNDGSVYGSTRGRGSNGRPETSSSSRAMTFYDGRDPVAESSRQRSQSVVDPSRQYTPDGRAILHYARALYMYQAAIPEELGFAKGDTLAVLRHQDDGWWEAEIHSGQGVGRGGLVPSNYLQAC